MTLKVKQRPMAWLHYSPDGVLSDASLHKLIKYDIDQGWQNHPLYSNRQLLNVRDQAVRICQDWINDHSKADNCTYNDCDMVAAVTDVMNKIKWMFRNERHSTETDGAC